MHAAKLRPSWALTMSGAIALMSAGCQGDDQGRQEVSSAGLITTEDQGGDGDGDGDGDPSTGDGDGEPCLADEIECGQTCCAGGLVCFEGSCEEDCGGEPPCGAECCGGGQVCYLGECVTPAGPCDAERCATKVDASTCEEGFICDAELGQCVPNAADPSCEFVPPPGEFNLRPIYTWGVRAQEPCNVDADCQVAEVCQGSICTPTWPQLAPVEAPSAYHLSSSPFVADLDGDCVPEVVFNTYVGGDNQGPGVVRAINGATGEQLWAMTDPTYASDGTASLALGDIDEDGLPEIVITGQGNRLVAIDNDGTGMWVSDPFAGSEISGATAIANLDNEGPPEIVFGAAVFNAAGALIWEGNAGIGQDVAGPVSCLADLDGDGRLEIIGGDTVYETSGFVANDTFSGAVRWQGSVGDGRCGVADFDGDAAPEIIIVRGGVIHALDGQSGATLASFPIPGAADRGGAPNIADFDGDGQVDIGTAGTSNYVVVSFDGAAFTELWRAATEDDSSRVTGSSVFDFDGDGRNEVIYNDELFIRIYPGVEPDCQMDPPGPKCDGVMDDDEVLFKDSSTSRTWIEYPIIADVDGDFKAELVIGLGADTSYGQDAGVEVWGDVLDNWVGTRPIWNQHTYHITNVEIDGTIPLVENDSWAFPPQQPFNSYRRNAQGVSSFCAPDLQLFNLQAEVTSCPTLELSVEVANLGCLGAGAGVKVSFYEQELGYLGTVQTQAALPPGASETVTLQTAQVQFEASVWAVVDDDGMGVGELNECDEDNQSDVTVVCMVIG